LKNFKKIKKLETSIKYILVIFILIFISNRLLKYSDESKSGDLANIIFMFFLFVWALIVYFVLGLIMILIG
jgi:hypothetical protein